MVKDNAKFLYIPNPVLTMLMSYVNMVHWSNQDIDIDTKYVYAILSHE